MYRRTSVLGQIPTLVPACYDPCDSLRSREQLQDAGFPQSCAGSRIANPAEVFARREDFAYVPTLEEILEACGDQFLRLVQHPFYGAWRVNSFANDTDYMGATPTEAVARLWLSLNGSLSPPPPARALKSDANEWGAVRSGERTTPLRMTQPLSGHEVNKAEASPFLSANPYGAVIHSVLPKSSRSTVHCTWKWVPRCIQQLVPYG